MFFKDNIIETTNNFIKLRKNIYENLNNFESNELLKSFDSKYPSSIFTLIKKILVENETIENFIYFNDYYKNIFKIEKIYFKDLPLLIKNL